MNTNSIGGKDIEQGQDWDVYLFRPEDAAGVARLFRSVYGKGYPIRTYIEPELLIQENAAKRTISSVAMTSGGDVIGHNALFNSAAHPGVFETGAGAVHRAYRGGKGVFTSMVEHGLETARSIDLVNLVFGESVCNHVYSQRMMLKMGFIPRAMEVDLISAAAHETEGGATGRVAAVLAFRTYRPRPHTIFLPEAYKDVWGFLYENLDDSRDFQLSREAIPAKTSSTVSCRVFDFAGVARITVERAGNDFAARITALEKELKEKSVQVIQVWLDLSCPWVGEAVDLLRLRGFFLGGALPRWFDSDGFLMQKILKQPDWNGILVHGNRSAEILRVVRADWERCVASCAPDNR